MARPQMLLTKEIEKALTKAYNERIAGKETPFKDQVVHLKLFNPYGAATWFITEYNPADRCFFGLCYITDPELGYVSLDEIKSVRIGIFNGKIERDMYYTPKPAGECQEIKRLGYTCR